MTQQEIFEALHPVSLYVTGSSANPYIKHPNDIEYVAVFENEEAKKNSICLPNEHIHKIVKEQVPKRYFIYKGYIFHYLNEATDYLGEKYTFPEPTIELLKAMVDGYLKTADTNTIRKFWYHVAMVEVINKFGYDNIPQSVADQINDLHDLKMPYSQFDLDK